MRPDGSFVSTLGLVVASIYNKHLVDLTVAIPVVIREIHIVFCRIDCFSHHQCRPGIVGAFSNATIISHSILGSIRPYHIEVNLQFPIALTEKIVFHRSGIATIRIARLIEEALESGLRIFSDELLVGKLHENDQSALFSSSNRRRDACAAYRHITPCG